MEIAKRKKEFLVTPNVYLVSTLSIIQFNTVLSDELEETINNSLITRYQQEKEQATIALFFSNYLAWLMQRPENINLENLDQLPKTIQIYQLLYAGLTYVDAGQIQQVDYIIKELEKLTAIEHKAIARFDGGSAYYALGIFTRSRSPLERFA